MSKPIFILGGAQSDFARNWAREGSELQTEIRRISQEALADARVDAADIQTGHVGNFTSELFCRQGHLGGLLAAALPEFSGLPCSRHEAACASSSIAVLAATAELEAGRYDTALVVGIEQMRNVPGQVAADYIGTPAGWAGHEFQDILFPWPNMFSNLIDQYDERYGIKKTHLAELAAQHFANARRNPSAQTRNWQFADAAFTDDDELNPVVDGRIRKQDCGQITDGAAAVVLANEEYAARYAAKNGLSLDDLPRIIGYGHRTAPISYAVKQAAAVGSDVIFPHVRQVARDSLKRAGLNSINQIDTVEVHDCFSITGYMAVDHLEITAPGESWKAIENGDIAMGGRIPVNPSGGLIGLGHPVGATGVRMLNDCARQVRGTAGAIQVENARTAMTMNIGGSTTTTVSFVVQR